MATEQQKPCHRLRFVQGECAFAQQSDSSGWAVRTTSMSMNQAAETQASAMNSSTPSKVRFWTAPPVPPARVPHACPYLQRQARHLVCRAPSCACLATGPAGWLGRPALGPSAQLLQPGTRWPYLRRIASVQEPRLMATPVTGTLPFWERPPSEKGDEPRHLGSP